MKELEEKVVKRMQRLSKEVGIVGRRDQWPLGQPLGSRASRLCRRRPLRGARKEGEEEGKEEEEEKEIVVAVSVQLLFMMSHFSLFTAVMSFFHEPLASDSHLLVLVRLWSTGSRIFPECLVRQWPCSCVSLRWLLVQFL